MLRLLAVPLVLLVIPLSALAAGFSSQPLPAAVKGDLTTGHWRVGCPVPLAKLRLLTVRHWGFDGRSHTGQLVIHQSAAAGLERVFAKLYELRFRIRHLQISDSYGPSGSRPADGDVSASFECRQAVPSPCSRGSRTGSWSNHAYGLAIDINPNENPYVGCGMTRNKARLAYLDRSRLRPGMVTPAVIEAFASIGWEWGGSWEGETKDYMHFSVNGR